MKSFGRREQPDGSRFLSAMRDAAQCVQFSRNKFDVKAWPLRMELRVIDRKTNPNKSACPGVKHNPDNLTGADVNVGDNVQQRVVEIEPSAFICPRAGLRRGIRKRGCGRLTRHRRY